MADPFLAMVIPVGGGTPTHPIAPGGPPPSVGGGPVYPPSVWPPPGMGGGGPDKPGLWPPPGQPGHPLPPTDGDGDKPGVWPPGGHPGHPLPEPPPSEGSDGKPEVWPPDHHVGHPLPPVLPIPPGEKPPQEPGTIWPPVDGITGDAVILVWVPFLGFRWVVIDFDNRPVAPDQPPQPK